MNRISTGSFGKNSNLSSDKQALTDDNKEDLINKSSDDMEFIGKNYKSENQKKSLKAEDKRLTFSLMICESDKIEESEQLQTSNDKPAMEEGLSFGDKLSGS